MARDVKTAPVIADESLIWDDTADVVVVGYSISGVAAALGASESGADVLALERGGGSEGTCGGIFYLGGGTPMQTAAGVSDTPAEMESFLRLALGPGVNEQKLHAYCAHSVEHYHWLAANGVTFLTEADPVGNPLNVPDSDGFVHVAGQEYAGHGLVWTGGEAAYPFDDLVRPVPRGHIPRDFAAAEPQLIFEGGPLKQMLAHAEATPIRVRHGIAAERLVIDDMGRVLGVQCYTDGRTANIRSNNGVILTTGGFIYNDDMLAQHSPLLCNVAKLGHGGQDGRGIQMAQAAGADVANMHASDITLIVFPPLSFSSGVLVNSNGMRFINEDTYFGRLGDASWNTHGGEVFLVVDEELFQESSTIRPMCVSESIEELEKTADLAPGVLRATLDYYNEHARTGQDPLFHKRSRWLRPLTPPYALLDLRNGARSSTSHPGVDFSQGAFTLGGLRTDEFGQVLRPDGDVVAGLFAAGRASSGLAVEGYCSGISLGDGTFFGRRAGRAAAEHRS